MPHIVSQQSMLLDSLCFHLMWPLGLVSIALLELLTVFCALHVCLYNFLVEVSYIFMDFFLEFFCHHVYILIGPLILCHLNLRIIPFLSTILLEASRIRRVFGSPRDHLEVETKGPFSMYIAVSWWEIVRSGSSTLCLCLCIVCIWLRAKLIFLFAQVGNLKVVSDLSLVLRACRHWCVNLVVVAGPYSPHSMVLTWCLHALVYIFHCVLYGAASIYLHVSFTFCCQIEIMTPLFHFVAIKSLFQSCGLSQIHLHQLILELSKLLKQVLPLYITAQLSLWEPKKCWVSGLSLHCGYHSKFCTSRYEVWLLEHNLSIFSAGYFICVYVHASLRVTSEGRIVTRLAGICSSGVKRRMQWSSK